MNEKILHYIWLSSTLRPGSKTPKLLLEHFGDIEKIFSCEKEDYEALSIPRPEIIALCNKDLQKAIKYYEYCVKNKIGILCYDDPCYPERLKIIENPPPMFYYRGRLNQLDDYPCITMVGTRSCSERGFRMAYETAFDASSKGAVIVNGLALGIDGACIAGALDANGYAIGLLGCGIDRIYPYGNKDLFERLSASGLILSEFAPFTEPKGENFPVRNRVISGLSLATVIFESGEGSGALLTAKHALEQGRRIFAVPGKPYDKTYAGPLELIKDGATVFTEADDVLTEYSMSFPHRINLANINKPSTDKLDLLVSKYFKKDTDPDAPVNRRYVHKNKGANESANHKRAEYYADKDAVEKAVNKTSAILNQREMPENLSDSLSETKKVQDKRDTVKTPPPNHDLSIFTETEKKIYWYIYEYGSLTPDQIAEKGIKIEDILSALTLLEVYGCVAAAPGGKYQIAQ